mgnify:CR=1
MFSFNFGQKFDVNHPPTPLSEAKIGKKPVFLNMSDVFVFCLDFFDMLDGSSWYNTSGFRLSSCFGRLYS